MNDLFISYSRKDISYARLLHKALEENNFKIWIDWQDIPPGTDWLKEVYTAIEGANIFIFILSASSILSEVCQKEIDHAEANNKRIIPIVIDDVGPSRVHQALVAINWIFSSSHDKLQPAIEKLIETINTDYEWVKMHTRLHIDALDWEDNLRKKSYLYSGEKLRDIERWLLIKHSSSYIMGDRGLYNWRKAQQFKVDSKEKSPNLTLLQEEFIESCISNELCLSSKWYRKDDNVSHYAPDIDLICIHCNSIYVFTPSYHLPFPNNCPVCGFNGSGNFD